MLTSGFLRVPGGLPCGKLEFGEDLEEAVLRELFEEAGIKGEVEQIVGYSSFMTGAAGAEQHNVQINFQVRAPGRDVTLDHSNSAFKWIPLDEYHQHGLDAFTVSTIQQAVHGDAFPACAVAGRR